MIIGDWDYVSTPSEYDVLLHQLIMKYPTMSKNDIRKFLALAKNGTPKQFQAVLKEWISHNAYPEGGHLEHVIREGCISYTMIGPDEVYAEKNKPLFYTDEQLKHCIRTYGSWKTFWSKFKYNMRYRVKFFAWWVCHLCGANLYSKNEVTAAVYEACRTLRENLKPGETLEDKVMQQFDQKYSSRRNDIIDISNIPALSIESSIRQNHSSTTENIRYKQAEIALDETPAPKKEKPTKINRLSGY